MLIQGSVSCCCVVTGACELLLCCVDTGVCELMLCCYWGLCVVVLLQGSVS